MTASNIVTKDNVAKILNSALDAGEGLLAAHAFERCLALREDMGKSDKKAMLESAHRIILEFGEPLDEDEEELLALVQGCHCPRY